MSPLTQGTTWNRRGAVALAIAVLFASLLTPLTQPATPAAAATPLSVTSGHPRLLFNDDRPITDLRGYTDATSVALKNQVVHSANYQMGLPLVTYELQDKSRMTTVAKNLVDRSYTLAMAWRLTDDTRYIERLWANLDAASRFPDWNPGHFLDTAEFAHAFAIAYDWGYAYWTDSRRVQLKNAMLTKALRPALAEYAAPPENDQDWVVATHNRNIVGNSGVGLASLAIASEDTSGDAQRVLDLALESVKNGLRGYLADGSYAEGPMYWEYATEYATTFLNALKTATGSTLGLESVGGILKSGDFIRDTMSPSGDSFTFGDSEVSLSPAVSLAGLSVLGGDETLQAISAGMDTSSRAPQRLAWRIPHVEPMEAGSTPRRSVANFPDVGVTALRGDTTDIDSSFAAVKWGSDVAVGHRQVDVGDVMIAVGGTTWADQLGLDRTSYAALGNGAPVSSRWNYYRNRLEGHNTLAIARDGANEFSNASGGTLVSSGRNGLGSFAVADLSASQERPTGSWLRGIRALSGARQIVLQDEFTAPSGVTSRWTLHTSAEVQIVDSGRSAILYKDGKRARLDLKASAGVRLRVSPALPGPAAPVIEQDDNSAYKKLVADVPGGTRQTVTATVTLLAPGSDPALTVDPGTVVPLSGWASPTRGSLSVSRILVDGEAISGFSPDRRSYTILRDPALSRPTVRAIGTNSADLPVAEIAGQPGRFVVGERSAGSDGGQVLITFLPDLSSVSSTSASSTLRGSPSATVDGNESTGWATRGDQYLDLTVRGPVDLHRVDVLWTANSSRRIDFRVLTESGGSWVPAASGSFLSASGWSTTSTAHDQPTSRIRIEVRGDPTGDRTSTIREIRLYGFTPDTPPPGLSAAPWTVEAPTSPTEIAVGEYAIIAPKATGAASSASFELATSDPTLLRTSQLALIGKGQGQARFGVYARRGDWEFPSTARSVDVVASDRISIAPTEDTFVEGGTSIDRNFGSANRLDVKAAVPSTPADGTRVRTALLKFDLSDIDPRRISSAALVLTGSIADSTAGETVRVDAHNVTGPWSGSAVTFRSRPTLGSPIGSGVVSRATGDTRIDLTDVLRQMTRDELASFDLALGGSTDAAVTLMARFGSLESDSPPRIEIVQLPVEAEIKTASATSTLRGSAAATHDGSSSSGWAARGGGTVTWDLQSESLVKTVTTDWTTDKSLRVSYKLSVSRGGSAWSPVGTFTYTGGAGRSSIVLPYSYRADRVRLELAASDATWQATLREISLAGPGTAADTQSRNIFSTVEVSAPETMPVGSATTLEPVIEDIRGKEVSGAQVRYRTDAAAVVSVSSGGRLSALTPGQARVTITVSQEGLTHVSERVITAYAAEEVTLEPRADTFVEGGASASTAFGTKTRLDVKPQSPGTPADGSSVRQAYVTFDVDSLRGSRVSKAEFQITGSLIDDPSVLETRVFLFASGGAADEARTTYANRPSLVKSIGSVVVNRETKARTIDVTDVLKTALASGSSQVTIALGGSVDSRQDARMTRFASREAGPATSPKLIVQRTQPSLGVAAATASYTLRGTPAATIDGDLSTGWATRGNQTLDWRLTSQSPVGSVRILWTANSTRRVEFELLGSTDGKSWSPLYDGAFTGASGWQTVYLTKSLNATHVRMVVHGDPAGDRQSVVREALILRDASL